MRNWLLYIVFAVMAVPAWAQPKIVDKIPLKHPVDPALPTNLFSRYDSHLDIQFDSEYHQLGNLWSIGYAFNDRHQVSGNALLAYNGRSRALGIGDIELNYFGLAHKDTNAFVSALGGQLSVQMPTGIYDVYLGIGAFRFTPSVLATLQFSKRFYMLPEAKYIFTTSTVQKGGKRPEQPAMNGYTGLVRLIYKTTEAQWLWITPIVTTNNAQKPAEFELEALYGVKVLNRLGFTAYVRRNFTTQYFQFQFVNAIYF
jgi:hypothetical protein